MATHANGRQGPLLASQKQHLRLRLKCPDPAYSSVNRIGRHDHAVMNHGLVFVRCTLIALDPLFSLRAAHVVTSLIMVLMNEAWLGQVIIKIVIRKGRPRPGASKTHRRGGSFSRS
jgi:hypothetical protein